MFGSEELYEEMDSSMKYELDHIALATSSIGTQRHIVAYRFGSGSAGPKFYLQAGLHADEVPGMLILHHLIRMLQAREDEPLGEIIVVPCANPIGLSQRMQSYHAGRNDLVSRHRDSDSLSAGVG